MNSFAKELKLIADGLLIQQADEKIDSKPNYTDSDFLNIILIFQLALMDKMYDLQLREQMNEEDMTNMARNCGQELRKFIKTYTNLDTVELVNNYRQDYSQ
jgi:hypothetical protein